MRITLKWNANYYISKNNLYFNKDIREVEFLKSQYL